MGLTKSAIKVLLEEKNRRNFSGKVLLLGKQDIYVTANELRTLAEEWNSPLKDIKTIELSEKANRKFKDYISDAYIFKCLGFSSVQSLDASKYENADIVFDLNSKDILPQLAGQFDLILDGGTLEHVFNFANAMDNLFKMLKTNGRIIHFAPSSNYIDHGFYMFSPTLFWDYYKTNSFEINQMQVFRHTQFAPIDKWKVSDYVPGCLNAVNFGGLDSGMYGIICIATKQMHSTGDKVPQQGTFEALWSEGTDKNIARNQKFNRFIDSILHSSNSLLHIIRKIQPLRKCGWYLLKILKQFRKKGLGLKVVKKY